jgi:hypothetical protein
MKKNLIESIIAKSIKVNELKACNIQLKNVISFTKIHCTGMSHFGSLYTSKEQWIRETENLINANKAYIAELEFDLGELFQPILTAHNLHYIAPDKKKFSLSTNDLRLGYVEVMKIISKEKYKEPVCKRFAWVLAENEIVSIEEVENKKRVPETVLPNSKIGIYIKRIN